MTGVRSRRFPSREELTGSHAKEFESRCQWKREEKRQPVADKGRFQKPDAKRSKNRRVIYGIIPAEPEPAAAAADKIDEQQGNRDELGIKQHDFIMLLSFKPDRKPLADGPVLLIYIIKTFRPDRDLRRVMFKISRRDLPVDRKQIQTFHRVEKPAGNQDVPEKKRQESKKSCKQKTKDQRRLFLFDQNRQRV